MIIADDRGEFTYVNRDFSEHLHNHHSDTLFEFTFLNQEGNFKGSIDFKLIGGDHNNEHHHTVSDSLISFGLVDFTSDDRGSHGTMRIIFNKQQAKWAFEKRLSIHKD